MKHYQPPADGYYKVWIEPMAGMKYKLYGPEGDYITCAETMWGIKRAIRKHRRVDEPHEVYRERA